MIGIIFIGDLKYCPYLSKYVDIINQESKEYEILFWNREGKKLNCSPNFISFDKTSKTNKSKLLKSIDFFQFKLWLNKKLKLKKYDKLILLSTLSGIILSDIILKNYKGKYIFDIRDYSYEHLKPFCKIEEELIRNSTFTCISSPGYKAFLPKGYPYVISHNFSKHDLEKRKKFVKKSKGNILNIVFIGSLRYFEHQAKIISHLKNDDRFKMIYHGTGPDFNKFIKFCKKNNVQNILFTGEYNNSDKYRLLHDADILNNSYKASNLSEVKYAISNKYYDGLIYGIPQLVENGTYKHKMVESLGIGIGIDENDNLFADKLYNYYFDINEEYFNMVIREELEKILADDEKYTQKIRNFVLM